MYVDIRTEDAQVSFWEYFVPIFGPVSLQCMHGAVQERAIFGKCEIFFPKHLVFLIYFAILGWKKVNI
jgi:hypothetical protein